MARNTPPAGILVVLVGKRLVEVVDRRTLAELWGISPSAIDNMTQSGKLRKVARGLIDYRHAIDVRATMDLTQAHYAPVMSAIKAGTSRNAEVIKRLNDDPDIQRLAAELGDYDDEMRQWLDQFEAE